MTAIETLFANLSPHEGSLRFTRELFPKKTMGTWITITLTQIDGRTKMTSICKSCGPADLSRVPEEIAFTGNADEISAFERQSRILDMLGYLIVAFEEAKLVSIKLTIGVRGNAAVVLEQIRDLYSTDKRTF